MALHNHLTEVSAYFLNGDTHLGYRRLLDAAIETNNYNIYESTLEFCDWYDSWTESKSTDNIALNEQVSYLLEKIDSATNNIAPISSGITAKAENISKKYNKGNFKLSSLNLELRTSQIIGLVGENGNGKTTLLRLLYGELNPDTGTIKYNLKNSSPDSFYDIKTKLAFIPQRPKAWYGSLMNNLQYTSTYYGFKGKENYLWTEMIIARLGLRPFRTYTWSRISSGYKMRFELARTLLRRPEILLLDEPLANLDVLAQQIILEDLKFLAKSTSNPLSIILSSQQLYEVEKVSEQVIFLQQGVAKFQYNKQQTQQEEYPLIVELETTADRDTLQNTFTPLSLKKISFNGGVYILYFDNNISSTDILITLGKSGLPVKYLRDISSSSRRFFDA